LACVSIAATAQEDKKTVSGTVTDAATGKPLAGVIVSAYDNQRMTTMTDENGQYELKVNSSTRSLLLRVDGYNLQSVPLVERPLMPAYTAVRLPKPTNVPLRHSLAQRPTALTTMLR
jgi:hypothetical protein